MAVKKEIQKVKLMVRLDLGNDKFKNMLYSGIDSDANDETLYKAGNAIGRLQPEKVEAVYRYDMQKLSPEG